MIRPGAVPTDAGTSFRLWAPAASAVEVVIAGGGSHPLDPEEDGYFSGTLAGIGPGARYHYRLDGNQVIADPASGYQPEGIAGPSEVVDPAFDWRATDWRGVPAREAVIYELHIGTFTPEGTFAAAADRLDDLAALGVTVVEVMPVAEFPGRWNWGYDGVFLFAPSRAYGRPEDFKRFIDAAHERGIAVILDVVYNHFGPEGNVLYAVTDGLFFTEEMDTPWGAAIDFAKRPVRDFFLANALHWVRNYRVDGFRFDATHAIHDPSTPHILREIGETVRAAVPEQTLILIAEDDRNDRRLVEHPREGGWGMDAVWADDFHHSMRRLAAGDHEAYFGDFDGTGNELATVLDQGWLYTGQRSDFRGKPRGSSPAGLPPSAFVHCVQNHDQVGNRALGERLHHQVHPSVFRGAVSTLLLSPYTPLLFMGQEWAASSPFLYFTDHPDELGRLVTEGRRAEFRHFSAFADPEARQRIPDPQAEETFSRSVLRWEEREEAKRRGMVTLHRELLALRRNHPAFRGKATVRTIALGEAAVALRHEGVGAQLLVIAVFSGELVTDLNQRAETRPGDGGAWSLLLATEMERYGGDGNWGGLEADGGLRLPHPGAVVLEVGRS